MRGVFHVMRCTNPRFTLLYTRVTAVVIAYEIYTGTYLFEMVFLSHLSFHAKLFKTRATVHDVTVT